MYAMLAMQSREHLVALWRFAGSIKNEFKRSHQLHKLTTLVAGRAIDHDLAEQIANSIPDPYWRSSSLNEVADQLLARGREFEGIDSRARAELSERGLRLLREVESDLSSVPETNGDRATVLWQAGLSLVRAGKLDWAERLASTNKYCPENTEVLLNSAKARAALDQTSHALQLAKTVAELASVGTGDPTNRVFDLEHASEIAFACSSKNEAREYLEQAARLALASQEHQDIEGWKCVAAVAIAFAKQGHLEKAKLTANGISQQSQREYVLRKVADVPAAS